MTDITNVILLTSVDDGAWMKSDHDNADILAEHLRVHYQGDTLLKVDHYAGGKKGMTCDIFIAAVDYLDAKKLIEAFNEIPWQRPDQVQLLLKHSTEETFREYRTSTCQDAHS